MTGFGANAGPFTRTGVELLTITGAGVFCAGASAGMSTAEGRLTIVDPVVSVAGVVVDAVWVGCASFELRSITPPNAAAPTMASPATIRRPLPEDGDFATGACIGGCGIGAYPL